MSSPRHFFHPPPTAISWQDRLDDAFTEAEVVGVVRDYVARLSLAEIELLPERCRPGRIHGAEDLSEYALELARTEGSDENAERVRRLSAFLSSATMRLSRVLGRGNACDTDLRESAQALR